MTLAHKMLLIVYAMLAEGTHYQNRTVDYEALMVGRNAPRWLKMLAEHGYITNAGFAAQPPGLRPAGLYAPACVPPECRLPQRRVLSR